MIVDEYVIVKNSIYYKKLGYESDDRYISIKVIDLAKNSRVNVNVRCHYCVLEKLVKYYAYNNNILCGGRFACSKKCSMLKMKENNLKKYGVESTFELEGSKEKAKSTNLEKYGTEYASQSKKFREKVKQTNLEKYGVEHTFQSEATKDKSKQTNLIRYGVENVSNSIEIRERIKNTNLEKYGFENPFQSETIKEKSKQTNLQKYGTEHPLQSEIIKEKSKQTNLEKYGVEYPMQFNDIKEKSKQTSLEKYGVEHPMILEEFKNKIKQTNLEKYGVDNFMKNDDYRRLSFKVANNENYIKYLGNKVSLFKCDKGHEYEINSDNYFGRIKGNISLCTICNPIGDSKSIKEKELFEYINSIYNCEIRQKYRNKLEIDIYLPELNIGFEFNGLYWHSDGKKDKDYHFNKTKYFNDKGIRIIHIWEDDWDHKNNIIKSQIRNLIGLSDKIWARKCQIKEVPVKEARDFLDNNHIQGFVNSNIKIGLYHNNELVSLMTFDKFEGRKKLSSTEYNLNRFCNKIGFSVIGGASKLLNYIIKEYKPTRIISYADRDWSIGNLYNKLGFEVVYISEPDYKYVVNGRRIHKSNFKKSITGLSENKLNINKIWDCGKIKFELKNDI